MLFGDEIFWNMADSGQVKIPQSEGNGSDLDKRKTEMTGRLQKRDDSRVAHIQRRKEEKDSSAAANENVDFFGEHFAEARTVIETGLQNCGNLTKSQLTEHFDKLAVELQKMQKFLSDSTMFLPSYQVQKAQETLNRLQTAVPEKREELLPKKKFGFKSKKKVGDKGDAVDFDVASKSDSRLTQSQKVINVNMTDCSFSDVKSQTLVKKATETNQQDVALSRLEDCTVKLYGSPSAIHINSLKHCKVFSGPVSGSVFIEDCSDCVFVMPCQQMRIHSTTQTNFYIHVTSRAIIEDCSNVAFAPYNWKYETVDADYELSGLNQSRNAWDDIDDFNWLASDKHSPNWSVLPKDQRVIEWDV